MVTIVSFDLRLAGISRCLTTRSDALFELTDAMLCGDGPVRSLLVTPGGQA